MPITILIDLDDTLLTNPINSFMPLYLKLLGKKLAPIVSPEKMVKQLLTATDQMIVSCDPELTLEQVFDAHFYPVLGLKKSVAVPLIYDFYINEFNELQNVTSLRPEAIEVVEYAVSKGHTLVVATNPLFPQSAMRSRLHWAGFTEKNFPFQFVTSCETMHFSKPNPAYYTEILGKLGYPRGPVCMIGNSLKEDVLPPSSFGIPTFWVDGNIENLPKPAKRISSAGPLDRVIPWLEELEKNSNEIEPKDFHSIMGILRSTPAVLHDLTRSMSIEKWKDKPGSADLSVLELMSHLLDVETEINMPRIKEVLSTENPFIVGIDSDTWIQERQYQSTSTPQVMSEFMKQRINSLEILTELTPEQWNRTARHSFFGPTTLMELVKFVAVHDIDHIRQVHRLVV